MRWIGVWLLVNMLLVFLTIVRAERRYRIKKVSRSIVVNDASNEIIVIVISTTIIELAIYLTWFA